MIFNKKALLSVLLSSAAAVSSAEYKVTRKLKKADSGPTCPAVDEVLDQVRPYYTGALPEKQVQEELLFVQMASGCDLELVEVGEKAQLLLRTKSIGSTFAFTDIPFRNEFSFPTTTFVNDFKGAFPNPPNGAITFVSEDDDQFEGPLVAIMDNPSLTADGGVTYELTQSKDQNGVLSAMEFFKPGQTVVKFKDCSLFIDDSCNAACTATEIAAQAVCVAIIIDEPECSIGVAAAYAACTLACG